MNSDVAANREDLPAWGRLQARPAAAPDLAAERGLHALGLASGRDGAFYVPPSYDPGRPAPLLLVLHGAGHHGRGLMERWLGEADRDGVLLVAPDSRGRTWDVLLGGYGPDVRFIDRALSLVFRRYAVDRLRVAVEGFSDGASYALSLGIANGDLFTALIANSPGFMHPPGEAGRPRIYVSHGANDRVLPIAACSHVIVPALRQAGYDVTFEQFEGGHELTPAIERHSFDWWLGAAGLEEERR